MHTVHLAGTSESTARRLAASASSDGSIKHWASAVGIIFDRDDYDPTITFEERKIIDSFFDAMGFEALPPSASYSEPTATTLKADVDVPYGDLMKIANFANRWAYTGSLTTPPCTVGVYFQVAERVLPISERHYNAYVAH